MEDADLSTGTRGDVREFERDVAAAHERNTRGEMV
jgi:hypothetical protein